MRTRRLLAALTLPLALVTACGDDADPTVEDPAGTSSPSASDTPTDAPSDDPSATQSTTDSATGPQCAEVWAAGATFPERYRGCYDGTELVQAESRYCEFGTRLFVHDDRFYAVPNGPVNETEGALARDDGYRTALAKCGG